MKATFIINQLTFELDAESAIDLFAQVSQIQEIFEAETKCGCCQSESLRYSYREVESFKFYELTCRECTAQFKFGQKKKDGALFPKRKDEDGNLLPNGGWSVYQREEGHQAPARQQQASPKPAPAPRAGTAQVPRFKTWHEAEHSDHWGEKYLVIDEAGGMAMLNQEGTKYVKAPTNAAN